MAGWACPGHSLSTIRLISGLWWRHRRWIVQTACPWFLKGAIIEHDTPKRCRISCNIPQMGAHVAVNYIVDIRREDILTLLWLHQILGPGWFQGTFDSFRIQGPYTRVSNSFMSLCMWWPCVWFHGYSEFFACGIGDLIYQDYESKGHKRLRSSKEDFTNTSWVIQRVGTCELPKNSRLVVLDTEGLLTLNSDNRQGAYDQGAQRQQ